MDYTLQSGILTLHSVVIHMQMSCILPTTEHGLHIAEWYTNSSQCSNSNANELHITHYRARAWITHYRVVYNNTNSSQCSNSYANELYYGLHTTEHGLHTTEHGLHIL